MKIHHVALAASTMAVLVGGVAEARSVAVSRANVDVFDVQSVDSLHRDLAKATARACRNNGATNLTELNYTRQCRVEALNNAVAGAGIPTLTALHESLDARVRLNASPRLLNATTLAAVEAAAQNMRAQSNDTTVVAALR